MVQLNVASQLMTVGLKVKLLIIETLAIKGAFFIIARLVLSG